MYLNADIPRFYCLLRKEYLYNLESHHGEHVRCCVFGVASIAGRAAGFHVQLDNGALIWRLPISALVHRTDAPPESQIPLDWLQLWDCFSYHVAVTEFEQLHRCRIGVWLKDRRRYGGHYLFTLDWAESQTAEDAGAGGHKCGHVIALDNGLYTIQPNNRIVTYEPATVRPFSCAPDYITMERTFSVEHSGRWCTDDSRMMFYEVEERDLRAQNSP